MKRTITIVLLLCCSASPSAASRVVAKKAAISSASPIATTVGLQVLRDGGNAIDAAIAVSFALAVSHPQAASLGGGGVLVYYEKASDAVWTLDFIPQAPMTAVSTRETGTGVGAAVNVPGTVAGLSAAHERFGSLPWERLISPAILMSTEGTRVEGTLERDLQRASQSRALEAAPGLGSFYPEGVPIPAGTLLRQPELAATLQRIRDRRRAGFYRGTTATQLIATLGARGGVITQRDLDSYEPEWRAPFRIDWGGFSIFTMAPPSTGGLIIGQALTLLSGFDLTDSMDGSPEWIHLLSEVERRAFLESDHQLADRTRGRVPIEPMFAPARIQRLRSSIDPGHASSSLALAKEMFEGEHTTHIAIVDAQGNAASLTLSLGENFGSGILVDGGGFFLNDGNEPPEISADDRFGSTVMKIQMRPASFMTPVIVLRDGAPWLVIGSRGGATIPTTILQVFLSVAETGTDLADAVKAPRFHHQAFPDTVFYERGTIGTEYIEQLNRIGHGAEPRDPIGEVYSIEVTSDGLVAVADPRGGGAAGGY